MQNTALWFIREHKSAICFKFILETHCQTDRPLDDIWPPNITDKLALGETGTSRTSEVCWSGGYAEINCKYVGTRCVFPERVGPTTTTFFLLLLIRCRAAGLWRRDSGCSLVLPGNAEVPGPGCPEPRTARPPRALSCGAQVRPQSPFGPRTSGATK